MNDSPNSHGLENVSESWEEKEEPKPPDPQYTSTIIAAEFVEAQEGDYFNEFTNEYEYTVKKTRKKDQKLTDINNNEWYKRHDGKWTCKKVEKEQPFPEHDWIKDE